MKPCYKCLAWKPIEEFYPHKAMSDGHLNQCKECSKKSTSEHYWTHREQHVAYEKEREQTPERHQAKVEYQRKYRVRNREKNLARQRVRYAVRTGRLKRQPCEVCGGKAQAHHTDYSKPLDVRWLCFQHHRAEHGQVAF